jgi:pimeloyl-ACP methyl ester carboxylesterase
MELVYLTTPDNYSCEGLFWRATPGKQTRLGAILVHGWSYWYDPRVRTRGFCGKYMAAVGSALAEIGVPAVLSMNRGFHAPEFFNDCAIDFQTNIEFLVAQGCEEIVIIGHSLGGAKCAYYAGEVGHPRLRGVVLMSAIPSSYNFEGREKEELIASARRIVAEGTPNDIISCREGKTVSLHEAATVVRSVDTAYRGTTLDAAAKISVPVFSFAAEREWSWFQVVTKGIQAVAKKAPSLDVEIMAGAKDHGYSGYEDYVGGIVSSWVRHRLLNKPSGSAN